jgi:acetolactate decarboxylase
VAVDDSLVGALHVQALRAADLTPEERPHETFQASTIAALIDGAYDGDVTFAELREHGDLGLGTLNGCDGEMIAIDGEFLRADVDGNVHPVPPTAKTPFAVLTFFAPTHQFHAGQRLDHEQLLALIDRRIGHLERVHALRVDGSFERIRARSVPKQRRPYRPLVEVIEAQNVFEFDDVEGTLVGFRFPDYAQGLNVPGYHLHFVDAERGRGGHVLECASLDVEIAVDDSVGLHAELPPGVELGSDAATAGAGTLNRIEHEG